MADYYPGEILIGGRLVVTDENRESVEMFLELFEDESDEYGGGKYGKIAIENLSDNLNENGHLVVRDDSARYGEFEGIEEFCRDLGLSYDRYSSPRYEYEGVLELHRPDATREVCITDNSSRYLNEEQIGKIIDELDDQTDASLANRIAAAKRKRDELLCLDVEDLPRLEIVEG